MQIRAIPNGEWYWAIKVDGDRGVIEIISGSWGGKEMEWKQKGTDTFDI